MRRLLLLYFLAATLPLFLGISLHRAGKYAALQKEVRGLEVIQEGWIESNKRLIAGITLFSSPNRIERIATNELGLTKKQPEEILQIRIENSQRRNDG
jgi:hypothetical protein